MNRRFLGLLLFALTALSLGACSTSSSSGSQTSTTSTEGSTTTTQDEGHCFNTEALTEECAKDPANPDGWNCHDVSEIDGFEVCRPATNPDEYCCHPKPDGGSGGGGGAGGGSGGFQ